MVTHESIIQFSVLLVARVQWSMEEWGVTNIKLQLIYKLF